MWGFEAVGWLSEEIATRFLRLEMQARCFCHPDVQDTSFRPHGVRYNTLRVLASSRSLPLCDSSAHFHRNKADEIGRISIHRSFHAHCAINQFSIGSTFPATGLLILLPCYANESPRPSADKHMNTPLLHRSLRYSLHYGSEIAHGLVLPHFITNIPYSINDDRKIFQTKESQTPTSGRIRIAILVAQV